MSLDNFFGSKDTKLTKFKNVFYFDNKNYKCEWLDNVPKDINFKKKINWIEYKLEVILCGKISTQNDIYVSNNSFNKNSNKIPLLKSHIQKNIRRCETNKAIKCAQEFLDIDFNQFIRRLSIIMIEDCVLHNSFSVLTWMIAAISFKKNDNSIWKPSFNDINYCLNIVKYLSELPTIDYRSKGIFNLKHNIKQVNTLDTNYLNAMYSLDFRKSYGGLKGDISMISYFSNVWLNRFKYKQNKVNREFIHIFNNKIHIKLIENIEYLKEYDLYSIDFHNNPSMLSILNKEYPDYSIDSLKEAIWLNRSSITNKNYIYSETNDSKDDNDYKDIYNTIKERVDKLSRNYIERL